MAQRIVIGLFESEVSPRTPESTMAPELDASFLGPVILGNFHESFANYIRNEETLVCVQALTDELV
jgi:hypothetical protein